MAQGFRIELARGTTETWPFAFTYDDDGSNRDVSADTVLLRVYSDRATSTLLFPAKTLTNGSATNVKNAAFSATDTATPGNYWAEIERRDSGAPAGEIKIGTLVIL